jgi:hypothetical protein
MSREQLAEQARREIDEAFREWRPPGHEEGRANAPVIEARSSSAHNGDRSGPVAHNRDRSGPVAKVDGR